MKNLTALILIASSIGIVYGFSLPLWNEIKVLRADEAKYSDALEKVAVLETTLKNQEARVASIPPEDMERLEKLLPDTVDNVKLIIDISNVAASQGLIIRDIGIVTPQDEATSRTAVSAASSRAGYDYIDLSFSVTAQYSQFLGFITALEQSLRLVDIIKVSFAPTDIGASYNFSVTLRTYWLK